LLGMELVTNRDTKEPVDESVAAKIAASCLANGLMIGRTNRSFTKFNNTLCLCPVLTLTVVQADFIVKTLDKAFSEL